MYEVNLNGGPPNQMAAVQRKLDMIIKAMTAQNISPSQQTTQLQVCAICSQFDHSTETCPLYSYANQEQANYVGPKYNPYSNIVTPQELIKW